MNKLLPVIAVAVLGLSSAAIARGPLSFQPGLYAQLDFGGSAPSTGARLAAQLSPNRNVFGDVLPAYLKIELQARQGCTLHMLGAPVAGYRFSSRSGEVDLRRQNGDTPEAEGGWFGRHGWKVGLGVLAAGAAIALAGDENGGSPDDDGNETDCGIAGNLPGDPTIDPNCLP